MNMKLLLTSAAVSLLLLSACSGGGSGSGSSAQGGDPVTAPADDTAVPDDYVMQPLVDVMPPSEDFADACEEIVLPENNEFPAVDDGSAVGSLTGILVDSPVSGLVWETPTRRGVTGLNGGFYYEQGEAVRFFLGDTLLGEVTAQAQVTPFDLAGSAVVTGVPAITEVLASKDDPFNTVINIAVLLQSLDRDANSDNGIEVTPQVAALFQGVSIDLNQHWKVFLEDIRLRYALAQANALGLFDVPRGVSSPALAIQHLYQTLGIDARTFGLSLEQSDEAGDGTPQDISKWQYDINGNVTRRESSVSDGRLQGYESWTYDALGSNTRYESEDFGQQATYSRAYNALGNLSQHQADVDGDGVQDIHDSWAYQYDEGGNLIRAEREDFADTGDGTIGSLTIYKYGLNGRLIRTESSGGDLRRTVEVLGIPDIQYLEFAQSYSVSREYDGNGVLVGDVRDGFNAELGRNTETRQFDTYGNAIRVESRLEQYASSEPLQISVFAYQYEYDGDGNVIRKVSDTDNNGKADEIASYQYDADGNVTREAFDADANGNPDLIKKYAYDALGNLTRFELDHNADGTADEIESWPYRYEYDNQKNLVRRLLDQNGDGRPNETVSYTYYASGILAQEDYWSTEGEEHYIRSSQYDTRGKLLKEESDNGGDGMPEMVATYAYDACAARKQREERDGEGNDISVETWRYDTLGRLRRYEWNKRSIIWPYDQGVIPPELASSKSEGFEGWQYDTSGQLTRYQLECQGDCFADFFRSLENQLVNYEYDSNGNVTRELYDQEGDGKPDRVTVYQYNSDDKVVRELSDENGDGLPNRVTSFEYDSNGRLTRREEDNDGDGAIDDTSTITYDSHGNITQETSDYNGDGKADQIYSFKHIYDADGNLIRLEEDGDGDGRADYIMSWDYDANGNETRSERDEGGDGVPENIEVRKYDINDNLVREEMYWQGGATPEQIRSYVYDAEGNLTSETDAYDWDQDGIVDNIETRYYSATGWGHIFAAAGEQTAGH